MSPYATDRYVSQSRRAISDATLQGALAGVQSRLGPATQRMYRAWPEGPGIRRQAHAIRQRCIDNLDILLERLADKVTENGGRFFLPKMRHRPYPIAWASPARMGSTAWSRVNPWSPKRWA